MSQVTYLEAIREGLSEEMERDPSVFLLGEDIGAYGGAFKVTAGFQERFGQQRVLDTPLAESAILGVAAGAALRGYRPVAEMQFSDFITSGFNQLVNFAAKTHYRYGEPVPMVVRCPTGGYIHGGPFHSQSTEAWFFHTPGLKLVAPSTPADAKGLMKAAIRDNNPVLYFEHKFLYRRAKGEVGGAEDVIEIGKSHTVRRGDAATIVTYGATVSLSVEAAEVVARDGSEVEVIDLRSLQPFDREAILESVQRTGRLLIVHEDTLTGGIGGEIAAVVSDQAFEYLDAPIRRVASLDTPVPFAPPMEEYFFPSAPKIEAALRELLAY
ncbi:MAG: alpha-ketoacid dehydrogenase subunit beta [Planctomycetota bacterium]